MARRLARLLAVALRGAVRSPLQSGLIGLAAIGGVVAVIASGAYAEAGRRRIVEAFDAQGVDMIVVSPEQSRAVGGRARTGALVETLTLPDYRALRTSVPDVAAASAVVSQSFRIRGGDLTKSATVVGCEPAYFRIKRWRVRLGELFDDAAVRGQARTALLGATVARDLFGEADPTGARIAINRVPFSVAGVLAERGQRLDTADEDEQVYVPVSTAMRRLISVEHLTGVLLEASGSDRMDAAADATRSILSARHRPFTRGRDDFQVQNQKALLDAQTAVFARFAFFAWAAGAAALAVAAFGVLALSWLAVGVRAHEIGVRRCLGATRSDVLTETTAEAGAAALTGCAIGLALGFAASRLIEIRLAQPAWFSWPQALATAVFALFLFAAAIAAASWRGVRIEPSEALRQV